MAKGFFNSLSVYKSADSAGIKPEAAVDPFTIKVMNEVGIDVSHYVPKKYTSELNDKFDVIVTIGCSNIVRFAPDKKIIQWTIEDPKGKSLEYYRTIRDVIKDYVERLFIIINENHEGKR
jgi:arsenate reductase